MRTPLFYATAALIAVAAPSGVRAQSMLDQIVIQKCSAAMQADFDKAGTPPSCRSDSEDLRLRRSEARHHAQH